MPSTATAARTQPLGGKANRSISKPFLRLGVGLLAPANIEGCPAALKIWANPIPFLRFSPKKAPHAWAPSGHGQPRGALCEAAWGSSRGFGCERSAGVEER